jgi:phosphoglycerol transferase
MRSGERNARHTARPVLRAALRRLGAAATVGVVAMVGAVAVLRPWGWRRSVPFSSGFDNQLNAIFVRNILSGSVYSTDRLGAPFGQHLQDFPAGGDRWSYLLVRLAGLVSHDPYTVLNITFILGFGLVAASMNLVARELREGVATGTGAALLTAYLPDHCVHGENHIWLANYAGQPLAVLLAVWVLRDELRLPLVHRRDGPWTRLDKRRLVIAVAAVVVLGGNSGYYAAFAGITIAAAGVLAQARRRSWRTLLTGAAVAAGVLLVLAANLAPELLWRARYGVDHAVAQRTVAENDTYALRLTRLLLPGPEHRVGLMRAIGRRTVGGEGGDYAGLAAALGLLMAWWSLLRRGLGRAVGTDADRELSLPVALGAVAAFVFLLGTAGGVGAFVAVAGVTQFRAWARVAVLLSICGLLSLGWFVEQRLPIANRRRWLVSLGAVVVLAAAFVDQVPRNVVPAYASTRDSLQVTRSFVRGMEAALPRDAMVFQLPVVTFPEHGPTWRMADYDLALPYILGDGRLRWSYGGVRGRAADWQTWWSQQPLEPMVRGVAAAGYDALYVDRRAYPSGGPGLLRSLDAMLGPAAATSTDGELVWFDLRPLRADLVAQRSKTQVDEAGRLVLHGVVADVTGDANPNAAAPGHQSRWLGAASHITFTNPLGVPRRLQVRASFRSSEGTTVRLTGPGVSRTLRVPPGATGSVRFAITVPADGTAEVTVVASGPDVPNLGTPFPAKVQLTALAFDEPAVRRVVGPG